VCEGHAEWPIVFVHHLDESDSWLAIHLVLEHSEARGPKLRLILCGQGSAESISCISLPVLLVFRTSGIEVEVGEALQDPI
jgi:hypothetical protein